MTQSIANASAPDQTVVIRFSSLGDVVLAGTITQALAPVTFITLPQYAELASRLPGVQRVVKWGQDPLPTRASRVVDLHASVRSRWASLQIRGPVSRIDRQDLKRRLRVAFKGPPPKLNVIERYAKAAGVEPAPAPWIERSSDTAEPRTTLLLCPGSRWATKQWPSRHWIDLGQRWTGPVTLLGGPNEKHQIDLIAESIGAHAKTIAESGFSHTFAAIQHGQLAVAGDTGLLHLCSAFGLPVVGLFGPTTSIDGFWWRPTGSPSSVAIEHSLPCRPCSRFGSETCPMGDHLCLSSISPSSVWEAVQTLRAGPSQ